MVFVHSDFCSGLIGRELVLEDASKRNAGKFMENCLIIAWSSLILMAIILLDNLSQERFFNISKTTEVLLFIFVKNL